MTVPSSHRPTVSPSNCSTVAARPCPVCNGHERRVLHRQRFVDGGPLGSGYDVVVCRTCGAAYADGIPEQAALDAYYTERSKYTYDQRGGAESPFDMARFETIADQVVPYLASPDARILDVGCATGGLLAVLRRRGFRNLLGMDPSPACAAAARRLHGIDVRTATLGQLAGWTERFDMVLLVGVLEHLRDVGPAVETVARRLAPGGLLYCAQPDVTAFADCVNAPYQQFSIEHVNFFSVTSLGRLMARCGLTSRKAWRWLVEWREGVTDSVVSGIYAPAAEMPRGKDQVTRPRITDHGPRTTGPEARRRRSEVRAWKTGDTGPKSEAGSQDGEDRPTDSRSDGLSLAFDAATEPALERYLARCREDEAAMVSTIGGLVRSQEPILIWGAGTLTRRLLATTGLSRANIVAFVDSSTALQGTQLAGRPILPPADLAGRREAIVIASRACSREIQESIRGRLGLENRIVLL